MSEGCINLYILHAYVSCSAFIMLTCKLEVTYMQSGTLTATTNTLRKASVLCVNVYVTLILWLLWNLFKITNTDESSLS